MSVNSLKRLLQHDPERWLRQSIRYFHKFGLLSVTVEEARAAMLRGWDAIIPADARDNPQFADMFLLSTCGAAVWWGDLECVYPNANAYVEILHEWAAISRGALTLSDVEETWDSAQQAAEITFTFNSGRHHFTHSERNGDFVDMAIVRLLNGQIRDTGYQLEVCDMGMPNFVLALTAKEKSRLRRKRGWRFEDATSGSVH